MRAVWVVLAAVLLTASLSDTAFARSSSGGGGGGGHSRSAGRSKSASGYIQKTCKTSACLKKHPTGHYAIPLHNKKS